MGEYLTFLKYFFKFTFSFRCLHCRQESINYIYLHNWKEFKPQKLRWNTPVKEKVSRFITPWTPDFVIGWGGVVTSMGGGGVSLCFDTTGPDDKEVLTRSSNVFIFHTGFLGVSPWSHPEKNIRTTDDRWPNQILICPFLFGTVLWVNS